MRAAYTPYMNDTPTSRDDLTPRSFGGATTLGTGGQGEPSGDFEPKKKGALARLFRAIAALFRPPRGHA